MAFAALAGPLISGVASVAGAAASAGAANKQADAEMKIAEWNAARQREESAWAQSTGAQKSDERRKQGEKQSATARAAMAQGGVVVGTGTSLLLEQEFASETAYRQNVEMANATKQQRDFLNKADITLYEGKVRSDSTRAQGQASLISGFAGAIKGIGGAVAGGGGFG